MFPVWRNLYVTQIQHILLGIRVEVHQVIIHSPHLIITSETKKNQNEKKKNLTSLASSKASGNSRP